MQRHKTISILLGTFFALSASGIGAEGFSTFENIAFQDFSIALCSQIEPSRAGEFAKIRNPPYSCTPEDPVLIERARKSSEYRALRSKLAKEMDALSKEHIAEVCRSLLDARCDSI